MTTPTPPPTRTTTPTPPVASTQPTHPVAKAVDAGIETISIPISDQDAQYAHLQPRDLAIRKATNEWGGEWEFVSENKHAELAHTSVIVRKKKLDVKVTPPAPPTTAEPKKVP